MTIKMEISNFDARGTAKLLKKLDKDVLAKAHRRALKRAKTTAVAMIARKIRTQTKARISTIKATNIRVKQYLKGFRIEELAVVIFVDKAPIPLIEFVKGPKKPPNKRGVKPSERAKVKLKYGKKGEKERTDLFIEFNKRGKAQVFSTQGGKKKKIKLKSGKTATRGVMIPQSVPGPAIVFDDAQWFAELNRVVVARLQKELKTAALFFLKREIKKVRKNIRKEFG